MGSPDRERQNPDSRDIVGTVATVDEVTDRLHRKWVLMEVTKYDDSGWPTQGVVIQCSPSRKKLTDLLLKKAKEQSLEKPYYLFRAIPPGRTVGEWRETLAKPGIETVDA